MNATIFNDDSQQILKNIESNSVHAIVTDPPAGIGFLGHEWDSNKGGRDKWVSWLGSIMSECLRVLKPGGHAVVWALPRTAHWTATAIENAGFEIRDVINHIFNSGVPAAGDVGKNVDKLLEVKPKVVGFRRNPCSKYYNGMTSTDPVPILEPQSELGRKWSGWMPRLKPACEHWIVARAPLAKRSIAQNILVHETGALNIEGCRVKTPRTNRQADFGNKGRFPSNVVISHHPNCNKNCNAECPLNELDHQSQLDMKEYFNSFYFCPKATKKERLEGVESEQTKKTPHSQTD